MSTNYIMLYYHLYEAKCIGLLTFHSKDMCPMKLEEK